MRDTIGRQLRGLARRMACLADRLAPPTSSLREERLRKWYAVNGDHTLRVEYDLTPESVVLDLGGFRGDWAAEIFVRYHCPIRVYEPVPDFAEYVRRRFARNPYIVVNPFGLAGSTRKDMLGLCAEGSSAFRAGERRCEIQLVAAAEHFADHRLDHIDLMKINIEGGEYELLEHLIETGWINHIRNVQVQFHEDVLPDAETRMRAIHQRMAGTHRLTYQHEFVWENWRRI